MEGVSKLDERTWRSVAIVLAVILAGMVGFVGILLVSGAGRPAASAIPAGAQATSTAPGPSSSASLATPSPGASTSSSASLRAATPTPAPTPTPIPSSPTATITFHGLQLDASADPNGRKRTFVIVTDGPGSVTVRLTGSNAAVKSLLCFSVGAETPTCRTWAGGTLVGTADTVSDTWTVTLIGQGVSEPTVNLSLTWPTKHPSVTVSSARFDATGTAGGFNGVIADFQSRTSGQAVIGATWGPVARPWPMHLVVRNLATNAIAGQADASDAAALDQSSAITAPGTWQMQLFNTSGLNPGPLGYLTTTLSWP